MRLEVDVTQQDIDSGKPRSCYECPISLALRRITGKRWKVSCHSAESMDEERFYLPLEARRFVDRFDTDDAYQKPEPFFFIVDSEQPDGD